MYVKDLVVRNIKRFSGWRMKEELREYVEENLVVGAEFALGLVNISSWLDLGRDRTLSEADCECA
jgi:hypothetical protein